MDLSKKVMRQAYIPFWKLAFYNCFMYTAAVAFMNLLTVAMTADADTEGKYPWAMVVCILLLLWMTAFRIPLTSLVEQKILCFEKKMVKIDKIETDGLFGDYKNSNKEIKYCYPKDMQAERNKLICIDEKGKRIKVRMIGSQKKFEKIKKMFLFSKKNVYITFGKLTRIVFEFESVEPCNSMNYNNVRILNKIF
ncbi:MAG: hypothetical protein PUB22_09305 [Clostridiales bacterium]|nr:hypothetical protein [Clostridiales bacterium]